jgi:mycothiol system anti-sigma-R factor
MTVARVDFISCEEVVRAVWDYLDDEIDLDRKERIREHLELCDHCLGQYTFEGAFLRMVSRVLVEDGDLASLRARIEQAMDQTPFPKPL